MTSSNNIGISKEELFNLLDPTIDQLKNKEQSLESVVNSEREKFRLHIYRTVMKKEK